VHETLNFLAQHGYWLLAGAVLGRQACLPIPANLFLVAAGALSRSGRISLSESVGLSVATFLFADFLWYCAGRRFGGRMLHFVCGLSLDPGSCVDRATDSFARHGVRILLVSKFVIGMDAVAVPLAGAAAIPPMRFLVFDGLGDFFWTTTYALLGYIFSEQLDSSPFTSRGSESFLRSPALPCSVSTLLAGSPAGKPSFTSSNLPESLLNN
jgi:membrane protein DedA with SNARE-associated domain